MKSKFKISGDKKFRKLLKQYAKHTKKSARQIVLDMAVSGGRQLATMTTPWGLSGKTRKLSESAVKADINKVYHGAGKVINALKKISKRKASAYAKLLRAGEFSKAERIAQKTLGIQAGEFDGGSTHQRNRRKGKVKDNPQALAVHDRQKVESYADEKAQNAGLAKSGWCNAIKSLKTAKSPRFQKWISRHKGTGASKIKGRGWKTTVTLKNKISYASDTISKANIAKAVTRSTRNTAKRYNRILTKKAKKI